MTHPGCRISSVRPKDGSAKLIILKPKDHRRRVLLLRWARELMDRCATVDGFAIVVWDKAGYSSCASIGGEVVPSAVVPDFVRNRLLTHAITSWAVDDVREMFGLPQPPPESA